MVKRILELWKNNLISFQPYLLLQNERFAFRIIIMNQYSDMQRNENNYSV